MKICEKGRFEMALEMIDSIRKAEKEASDIRYDACEKAKEIIAKAAEKAKTDAEEAEKNAYAKASAIAEDAKLSAEKISADGAEDVAGQLSGLKAAAEGKLDCAADFILKELFKI